MSGLDQFVEYQAYLIILKIGMPILILCGTLGNIISLIVLLKPEQRRSPTARILTVLAFSDITNLWTSGLYNWLIAVFNVNIFDSSIFVCKFYSFMNMQLSQISTLFIAALTLNRFFAVLLPFKVKIIFTLRNTNILLSCLVLMSILISCHILIGFGLTEQGQCAQAEEMYDTLIMKVWRNAQIVVLLGTIACVFLANICIIGRLVYRNRLVKKLLKNRERNRSDKQKTSDVTRTLVLVNVIYLICNIPLGAFGIKYGQRPLEYGTDHGDAVMLLFWAISITTYLVNNAINFILYFLSASQFRKEVKKLFK